MNGGNGGVAENVPNPSILPEFFGNIILVNGKAWPKLDVEPRQYRFRLLNGSDSRFYNLTLTEGVKMWQIGSDNGLLKVPVLQKKLLIAPGERKDIVIDFSTLKGKTIIVRNDANTPYPNGDDVDAGDGASLILAFEVSKDLNKEIPLSRVNGLLTHGRIYGADVNPPADMKVRKLILFEGVDEYGRLQPMLGTFEAGALDWDEEITENPDLNATEMWEVYNLTPDAHPVHLHLVQFQVLNSQKFEPVYASQEDEAKGKVSEVKWLGPPMLPERGQQGKKDTYPVAPGEVTRLIATFDRLGRYVWHCHILSHEDHEMMRPYYVGELPGAMVAQQSHDQKSDEPAGENAFDGGMYSVFPNPFSTSATLQFKVEQPAAVAVRLIDLSGRIVREVPVQQLHAGQHKLEISASDMKTGMYICEVEVNRKLYRSRLVLAR
ncbi:multicopper oxidase domain-containing protein [Pontibacter sp. MBLB2868]|uniref:multicopper oxidase domain-containing protein n=1 Tax=Pontibacter sp. MBLB2868 TaxID=3451555 RepID=UPI003F74CD2E